MTSPALQIALAHHRAWTSKDLETAMTYIADDVVLDAPAGRLQRHPGLPRVSRSRSRNSS